MPRVAVISHHGQHLGAGHYTCDVRRRPDSITTEGSEAPESNSESNLESKSEGKSESKSEGKSESKSESKSEWYHCDDSNVRRVPLSEVLSRQAYVLFYERVTTAAGAS